jgi:hypothetical protein
MVTDSPSQHISRLYLFVVCALLGAGAAFVYFKYGVGLGAAILAALFLLALWGTASRSSRVRGFLASLFASPPF